MSTVTVGGCFTAPGVGDPLTYEAGGAGPVVAVMVGSWPRGRFAVETSTDGGTTWETHSDYWGIA